MQTRERSDVWPDNFYDFGTNPVKHTQHHSTADSEKARPAQQSTFNTFCGPSEQPSPLEGGTAAIRGSGGLTRSALDFLNGRPGRCPNLTLNVPSSLWRVTRPFALTYTSSPIG